MVLSGITKDQASGENTVLYAFDVKVYLRGTSAQSRLLRHSPSPHSQRVHLQVFGVTVYKFFDRYSRLRSVHQNMKAAGCLSAFPMEFPSKSWLTNHAADPNAQQDRGRQLLAYYASLFTNAQVRALVTQ